MWRIFSLFFCVVSAAPARALIVTSFHVNTTRIGFGIDKAEKLCSNWARAHNNHSNVCFVRASQSSILSSPVQLHLQKFHFIASKLLSFTRGQHGILMSVFQEKTINSIDSITQLWARYLHHGLSHWLLFFCGDEWALWARVGISRVFAISFKSSSSSSSSAFSSLSCANWTAR